MSNMTVPASIDAAPEASRPLLETVKVQMGRVPNMFLMFANSPAALRGYLGLSDALAKGALNRQTRDRIALAIGQLNGCNYCLSAHTYFGGKFSKLEGAEMAANRQGTSQDAKADVAVHFAVKLAQQRGQIDSSDVAALRTTGYSDAEILEIIAHVALNTLTNYVNEALDTPVDFPLVQADAA
jgi:uncharacterized peroxidase-related enzyme